MQSIGDQLALSFLFFLARNPINAAPGFIIDRIYTLMSAAHQCDVIKIESPGLM